MINKNLALALVGLLLALMIAWLTYFNPSSERLAGLAKNIDAQETALRGFFPPVGRNIGPALVALESRQRSCTEELRLRRDRMLAFLPPEWLILREAERPGYGARKKLIELRESLGRKASASSMALPPSLGFGDKIAEKTEEAKRMVNQLYLVNTLVERALDSGMRAVTDIVVLPMQEGGTKETFFMQKHPVEIHMIGYTRSLDRYMRALLKDKRILTEDLIVTVADEKIGKAQYPLHITLRVCLAWQILQQGMYEQPGKQKGKKPVNVFSAPGGV